MSSAAPSASPADRQAPPRRRNPKPSITRKSGLQLLAALLVVAGIPVVATVRILDSNALRNERAHADTAIQFELQSATNDLGVRSDNAASAAQELSGSHALQRAFLTNDRKTIRRIAAHHPRMAFYLHGKRVAGPAPKNALVRPVSLTLNGAEVGHVVGFVPFDRRLQRQLRAAAPHAPGDRLLFVRNGAVDGSGEHVEVDGRTVKIAGRHYRGLFAPISNGAGTRLLGLRPMAAITAAAEPYKNRVMIAAIGSFALLMLVGLLFGGPIVRTLGDFRRIASQAATDSLTGLGNRWTFDEELALEWRRAERVGDPLALILADIDDFKAINDQYGHQVGDEVLRVVGRVLQANVRQVDLAARYGGEEFAVIVPETDLQGAVQLAERLRVALEQEQVQLPDGSTVTVTASFGAAVKGDLPRAEELVAAADETLYEAKRSGKNRVAPAPSPGAADRSSEPAERRRRHVSGKR
ncbi:MAG TPA: GGDEF domain-containing protein [Gaiellaceae bacterium]|nr:GGDEF domain-containing protein [Gaiellaceae bacterium]